MGFSVLLQPPSTSAYYVHSKIQMLVLANTIPEELPQMTHPANSNSTHMGQTCNKHIEQKLSVLQVAAEIRETLPEDSSLTLDRLVLSKQPTATGIAEAASG
eukprot:scaffold7001_cov93-Skeletonema_dohrnii-CCMP3373.AAC.3